MRFGVLIAVIVSVGGAVAMAGAPVSQPVSFTLEPATAPAEPERRGLPTAIDSPPFPSGDWTGASDPLIGTRDTMPLQPLEKFLKGSGPGDFLTRNRIRIYGWFDLGANISTSHHSNAPESYALASNYGQLDQAILRIERILDTVQRDHIDWGFRISNLYGTDYRYTAGKGYLDGQLLRHNRLYGYDPVEMFAQIYFPHLAQGVVIKAGRYFSPADIEAQLSPQNYMYTHSIMFTFDPVTYTGALAEVKLNDQLTFDAGFHFGNDVAPWTNSERLNGLFLVHWVSKDNNDSIWGGLNSIGAGKYTHEHDNLQQVVAVWGHRFNERLHMQTEAYYMWQFHALTGGTVNNGPPKSFLKGVGPGSLIPGRADEWGLVNYFEIKLSSKDYLTIRNDILDDMKGQRTGFKSIYTSNSVGWSHNFNDYLTIRPELRYERAWRAAAYDNSTKTDQFMFAMDLILKF